MLLVLLTVSTLFIGSSADVYKVCYGTNFPLPSDKTTPLHNGSVVVMPRRGESIRKLMENGTSIEPRLKVSFASATLTDLTERDEGIYFVGEETMFTLVILDCAKQIEQYYGETWNLFLPEKAEILEFSPLSRANTVVLWNRTNPQVKSEHRGQVYLNFWQVENVTPSENGFYNIRQKDNTLLSRINLDVKGDVRSLVEAACEIFKLNMFLQSIQPLSLTEQVRQYTKHVDDILIIEYPWDNGTIWYVKFQPKETTDDIILIKDGLKHPEKRFDWRLEIQSAGIKIVALEITDSGTFRFRDKNFDLVLVAHLEMKDKDDPPPHPLLIVFISVAFVLFGLATCWFTRKKKCWKKCCRKNKSAPQVAEPTAAHYDSGTQSVVSSYSAVPSSAAHPENSLQKPTVNPHDHSVAPSGESAAPASNVLSSDSDPQLESALPSSQPLSSD